MEFDIEEFWETGIESPFNVAKLKQNDVNKTKINLEEMPQEEWNEARNTAYKHFDIDDDVREDDVEKLAEEFKNQYSKVGITDEEVSAFILGFNKAKETLYTELINWIDKEILLNTHYKDSSRLKEGVTIVKNRLIIKNEIHKRTIS